MCGTPNSHNNSNKVNAGGRKIFLVVNRVILACALFDVYVYYVTIHAKPTGIYVMCTMFIFKIKTYED